MKKKRPLSANRKVQDSSDWATDKLSLAEAMRMENESIKAARKPMRPVSGSTQEVRITRGTVFINILF